MPNLNQTVINQNSTTSYVTLLKARIIGFPKCTIVITNSHGVNGIKFKVFVSNDVTGNTTSFAIDKDETTLAAGAASTHVLTGSFAWVDVKIIDSSSGNHGIGNAYLQATGV